MKTLGIDYVCEANYHGYQTCWPSCFILKELGPEIDEYDIFPWIYSSCIENGVSLFPVVWILKCWSFRHVSNLSLAVTNCLVFQLLFVLLVFSLILSRLSVIFQDNLLLSWYRFVFFFPVLSFWCLLVLLCSFQDFAAYVIPLFCHYTKYCLVKAIWCQFDPSRPFFLVMHFEFLNFRILVNFFVLLGISLTEPI